MNVIHEYNRGPILQHGFFSGAATRTWPLVLPRLVAVYVQRCYEVWGSDSEAMQFLYEGAREVAQEVDHGSWVRITSNRRQTF